MTDEKPVSTSNRAYSSSVPKGEHRKNHRFVDHPSVE